MKVRWLAKSQGGVGRPRSLTRDMVIDAAMNLGLDQFSMKRVAEHLGVGIATLYQYVANRDDLLRLAIDRQLETVALPADHGQSWQDYIIEYAVGLRDVLASEPHLILQVMDGGGGIERELALTERFVEVLVARDFGIDEAVAVWRALGSVTLGAAIALCRDRAAEARNGSSARMLRQAFAHFEPDQLPLMRKGAKAYAQPVDMVNEMLLPIIESLSRQRGETFSWEKPAAAKPAATKSATVKPAPRRSSTKDTEKATAKRPAKKGAAPRIAIVPRED